MTDSDQRRLAAIVLADVVGYSRLMGADEGGTLAALRAHRSELVDPLIAEHGGRIVKTMGDGLLLEFPSVVDAVKCSLDIQRGMVERNADVADSAALRFRIGVHLGDIIVEGDDIYGDGVNVAARIEALAEPDGIAISDDAHRQVRDRLDVTWRDGGEHQVKNIARAISIWCWASSGHQSTSIASAANEPLSTPDGPSIAVLPFENISGDAEQEYFADGITEDIITSMSKISKLFVIARNSSFTYKGSTAKAQDVGHDLGVRYILLGSVRKASNRVRVTAQLVDTTNGQQLWAERYDRDLNDIFELQDELSLKIVSSTAVQLSDRDTHRLAQRRPENIDAYDQMLRGRDQLTQHTPEANALALEHFKQAAVLDPEYAEVHVHLAEAQLQQMQLGWSTDPTELLSSALEYAQRAIDIDDEYGPGHGVLGQIYLWQRNYDGAVVEGERRVALDPGDAEGLATLAMTLVFSGEPERALGAISQAMRLDPQYPFWHLHVVGLCNFALERYDEAISAFRRGIVRNPESMPLHMVLAASAALAGDLQTAEFELSESKRLVPNLKMSFVSEQVPYQHQEDTARLVAGLKIAGLDE